MQSGCGVEVIYGLDSGLSAEGPVSVDYTHSGVFDHIRLNALAVFHAIILSSQYSGIIVLVARICTQRWIASDSVPVTVSLSLIRQKVYVPRFRRCINTVDFSDYLEFVWLQILLWILMFVCLLCSFCVGPSSNSGQLSVPLSCCPALCTCYCTFLQLLYWAKKWIYWEKQKEKVSYNVGLCSLRDAAIQITEIYIEGRFYTISNQISLSYVTLLAFIFIFTSSLGRWFSVAALCHIFSSPIF